jgi:hypothetical protein
MSELIVQGFEIQSLTDDGLRRIIWFCKDEIDRLTTKYGGFMEEVDDAGYLKLCATEELHVRGLEPLEAKKVSDLIFQRNSLKSVTKSMIPSMYGANPDVELMETNCTKVILLTHEIRQLLR